MAANEIYYDPWDYAIDANPHPVWKRMRDEAPLYYNPKFDFYALSRYADVRNASLDWRTYSSAFGSVLEIIDAGPRALEMTRNMLFEDPPIHDLHRAILAEAFSPGRIASLEPGIRALCASYLDPLVGSGGFDFVRDYGAKIPMMVIGMLMGVPEEDREYLMTLADAGVHRDEGQTGFEGSNRKVHEYFAVLVSLRRKEPRDDLTTAVLQAKVDDGKGGTGALADREILQYLGLLSGAGVETVVNLMGWTGMTLFRHPEQRQVLADDPSIIPNAVEELLRYEAPSPIQARVATHEVELHGSTIPEGSKVALLTGSANRDDRVWPDPDRFNVRRSIDKHVSFGVGIHFCVGAALARLEGRLALEEMLKRFPTWEVDEDAAEMVHTSTVRGWARLPIRV